MEQLAEILLDRQSANDDSATLVEIRCASGSSVKKDQCIFAVETSKAIEEIRAPLDGILFHALNVGETISFGVVIARIRNDLDGAAGPDAPTEPNANGVPPEPKTTRSPRFSLAAAALAAQHGVAPAAFFNDFVTTMDVLRHLNLPAATPPAPLSSPAGVHALATNLEPVPARKREEILHLSHGAGASMLSVVGADLGAGGLRRENGGLFETRIVDLVIHESSRLMLSFKKLNAAWRGGGIEYHAEVHAGMAYDNGGKLLVYGIANSDQLSLLEIQDEIVAGLKKYQRNRFTAKELSRATFTITDLSHSQTDFLFPLLPNGQSCIIGIAGGSERGYRLYLGFDHRVTEGLEASRFLHELCGRLADVIASQAMVRRTCGFCGANPSGSKTLVSAHFLRIVNHNGNEALCCRGCWSAG